MQKRMGTLGSPHSMALGEIFKLTFYIIIAIILEWEERRATSLECISKDTEDQ